MIKGDNTALCVAATMADFGSVDLLLQHGARADLGHPLAYFGESFNKDSSKSIAIFTFRSYPVHR